MSVGGWCRRDSSRKGCRSDGKRLKRRGDVTFRLSPGHAMLMSSVFCGAEVEVAEGASAVAFEL